MFQIQKDLLHNPYFFLNWLTIKSVNTLNSATKCNKYISENCIKIGSASREIIVDNQTY